MNQITVIAPAQLPALITASGDRAAWRFMEFFTAAIRNPNTRRAYARDVRAFVEWGATTTIGNHTFLGTGITAYLKNGHLGEGARDGQPCRQAHRSFL